MRGLSTREGSTREDRSWKSMHGLVVNIGGSWGVFDDEVETE